MTETAVTSDDGPGEDAASPGESGPAAAGTLPSGQGDRHGTGSSRDETPDGTPTRRLCGYRGCRAPLPQGSGRGNRAKYCQDGKTWGPRELSCRQAETTLEQAASLGAENALADASVAELGAHVDTALGPVQELATTLQAVRGQIDDAVTAAQAERDAAEEHAAQAEGHAAADRTEAEDAARRAEEADEAAAAAARRRAEAEQTAEHARQAQRAAERAQTTAEGRYVTETEARERAERLVHEATERAQSLETELATVRAELAAAQQARDEHEARAEAETTRAQQAATDAAAVETRLREEHHTQLEEVRSQQQRELEQRDRHAREEAQGVLQQERQTHAAEIARLHQQVGQWQASLQQLQRGLGHLVHSSSEETAAGLRERLQALLPTGPENVTGSEEDP